MIISTDAEKCLTKFNTLSLIKTLNKLEIEENYFNIMKNMRNLQVTSYPKVEKLLLQDHDQGKNPTSVTSTWYNTGRSNQSQTRKLNKKHEN